MAERAILLFAYWLDFNSELPHLVRFQFLMINFSCRGVWPEIDDEPLMGEFDRKEPSLVEATGNAVPSSSYNAKKKKDPPPGHPSGPLKANPANLEVGDSLIRRCMTSILKRDLPLWIFPNFSYSLAICRFYVEQQGASSEKAICRFYVEQQGASSENGKATSTELLQRALMRSIEIESKFRKSHAIWRLLDLQKLLEKCALQVVETLERDEHDESDPYEGDDWDWAWDLFCVCKEALYSHMVVLEFSDPMVIEG
ncbi:hypothetical protein RHGRI_002096 [Rhododendron griersonianum]|uniref:Uncharacterized protein n=1 Tax=Rhododendron griersonianum TaxID=479676 RepID=A0AAV6LQ94_9ERIC|nr:hypothetical protein RHGRI_002096 [Rhododendron griersonianum]